MTVIYSFFILFQILIIFTRNSFGVETIHKSLNILVFFLKSSTNMQSDNIKYFL